MLNEKPNSDFHWKSKLEELESLPGETFNKEAAWEKLHSRIQGKSRNHNAAWYWAAAACLLLALLLPLFLTNRKEGVLVKNNIAQEQIESSSRLLKEDNKVATAVIPASLPVEKKPPALSVAKSNKINSLFKHNPIQYKIVRDKKEKEQFTTRKITDNAVLPVDTAIRIVAILPERKKLKVVHINELGETVEETPIARYSERHSSQKFINQQVYTSSLPTGNTGFNIFKSKNIPSN